MCTLASKFNVPMACEAFGICVCVCTLCVKKKINGKSVMSSLSIGEMMRFFFPRSHSVSLFSIYRTILVSRFARISNNWSMFDAWIVLSKFFYFIFALLIRSMLNARFSIWYLFSFIYILCFVQCHIFSSIQNPIQKSQYNINTHTVNDPADKTIALLQNEAHIYLSQVVRILAMRFFFSFHFSARVVGRIQFSIYNLQCSNRFFSSDETRFDSIRSRRWIVNIVNECNQKLQSKA